MTREEIIEEMADAIEREFYACVDEGPPKGDGFKRVAQAAYSVLEGRMKELEPAAFLKFWFDDGAPRCRVDMTDICEPWLDALKPTITPLYSLATLQQDQG
jgi:hypothetical protein